jgi:hypothetical protein
MHLVKRLFRLSLPEIKKFNAIDNALCFESVTKRRCRGSQPTNRRALVIAPHSVAAIRSIA